MLKGWKDYRKKHGDAATEQKLKLAIAAEKHLVEACKLAGPDFCVDILSRMIKAGSAEAYEPQSIVSMCRITPQPNIQ